MLHIPVKIKTLTYKGKIVFEKVTVSTFKRIPKLFHDNEACFMFINEGEFSVRTPNELVAFKKGKGLLAKCFNYFTETNSFQRERAKTIELIGVMLYPDLLKELFSFEITTKKTVNYNINKVEIDALLLNFKESINILLENPSLCDDFLIINKLKEFVLLISKTVNAPSELEFLSQIFSPIEYDFKATIEKNLYSDLTLKDYARLCTMSIASFNRKFKSVYSKSPRKYITEKKLQKATQLLLSKENRIADIAFQCGFESISTFNRVFSKHFKKSPTAYRLEQNEQLLR